MIKNKQHIIWKLQKKVDSYFNNKNRFPKHNIHRSACMTVIWMVVEKGYAITTACRCIGKKYGIRPDTISSILRQHVFSKKHMKQHSKICQSKFFRKLESVNTTQIS